MIVKIKKYSKEVILPRYAHRGDAGLDLFSNEEIEIPPNEIKRIETGISMELPENTEAQIRPRSGLALNNQITVLNTPGTIDEGYRGPVGVILINHSKKLFLVKKGMKIAQLVIKPVFRVEIKEVDKLSSDTERGRDGYGSTGNQ